jgi:putative transposase
MRRGAERQLRALAATDQQHMEMTDDAKEEDFFDLVPLSVEEWS